MRPPDLEKQRYNQDLSCSLPDCTGLSIDTDKSFREREIPVRAQPATRPLLSGGYSSAALILLQFQRRSDVFVVLWRRRFWCETGAGARIRGWERSSG